MKPSLLAISAALLSLRSTLGVASGGAPAPEGHSRLRAYSRSVAWTPGADGKMHSVVREAMGGRSGDGPAAEVVRYCEDGRCQERRVQGQSGDGLFAEPAVEFPDIGLDDLAGLGRMLDAPLAADSLDPLRISFRRASRVREGGRQVVDVLRCRNGRCTQKHRLGGADAPAPEGSALAGSESESVSRSVSVTDVNGHREETEVVTRCHNGRCSREEHHRGAGNGAEKAPAATGSVTKNATVAEGSGRHTAAPA
mmetsp:Transcript_107926/g.302287  ORF Transcript_107926/g.302287 Transcript_107926/m.302287 type:complete len:253 (+) Transcript_107926:96-854(+)